MNYSSTSSSSNNMVESFQATLQNTAQVVTEKVSGNPLLKAAVMILGVYLLYLLVSGARSLYLFQKGQSTTLISGIKDAKIPSQIKKESLPASEVGNEFTLRFWMYIDDWTYQFGQPKHIFHMGDASAHSVCPGIWLYPRENSMMVRMDTANRKGGLSMNPRMNKAMIDQRKECDIALLPLQKWTHIALVVSARRMDVFVDGVIQRTCTLDSIPIDTKGDIFITQFGGFGGQIANMVHVNKAVSTNEIIQNFKDGM